jgi:uroporphyrinogen-III synthase
MDFPYAKPDGIPRSAQTFGRSSFDDRWISLGPNSLALLVALASSNSVLSPQELIACLPDNPDDHALHMAMSRLRRALEVPGLITTIMKRGYRFNAERID